MASDLSTFGEMVAGGFFVGSGDFDTNSHRSLRNGIHLGHGASSTRTPIRKTI